MLGENALFRWITFSPYLCTHVTKTYPFKQKGIKREIQFTCSFLARWLS